MPFLIETESLFEKKTGLFSPSTHWTDLAKHFVLDLLQNRFYITTILTDWVVSLVKKTRKTTYPQGNKYNGYIVRFVLLQ